MKKSDLVKTINHTIGITAQEASDTINLIFDEIAKELKDGGSYNHDCFGTFKIVNRAPRTGRNPQTGESVAIPAKRAVKFIVSGKLKKELNKD